MKVFLWLVSLSLLSSCNIKDGLKETGDTIQDGVSNVGDVIKETPAAISEALNKIEKDIRD